MPIVDRDAFLKDLYELRQIGAYKTGVHRPTYGPEDMQSRSWLMDRMREAGLEPSIDGIGNVLGRHKGAGPHVLVGSHIESQNHAGWLDGALGVVAGLALARAGLAVDVCAFADEEGHFTGGFLGSRSFIGDLTEDEIDRSRNRKDGSSLRSSLENAGLAHLPRMKVDADRYKGFFEMHIEQGTQLESAGLRLAVVTGIVGIWIWQIIVEGRQDHAGGTTMAERRDAGLTAVRLLGAIDRAFPDVCGEHSVWTTGNITLEPGTPNGVIPGRAEVWLEFRDISPEVLERMEARLQALVRESNRRERCVTTLVSAQKSMPARSDAGMMRALSQAADHTCPGKWRFMPSGAGHDAKVVAKAMPMVMLFVPSIGGVSHHWDENTSDDDLALGVETLAGGVERFISG